MKSIRFPLLLWVMMMVLLLVGGCSKHYVDVYINEDCKLVLLDSDPDAYIDPLVVFPGDYVIFNNLNSDDVKLVFPSGLFEVGDTLIESGHRVIFKVIADSLPLGSIRISSPTCPSTNPKVIVGEDP